MWRNIKKLVICLFVVLITSVVSFAQQEPNNTITLEALPKVTKGFPLVFKITVSGPQEIPPLSIFDNEVPITVYFKSITDVNEFTIRSFRKPIEMALEDGSHINVTNKIYPPIEIPDGEKYSFIFDIASLFIGANQTSLSDIPPGNYSIFVELTSADPLAIDIEKVKEEHAQEFEEFEKFIGRSFDLTRSRRKMMKSNSIDIELIEPTEKEKQFIEKVLKLSDISFKDGINWTRILRRRIVITEKSISGLSQVSKKQISLHKLLSRVDITDDRSKAISLKNIRDATLPEFFEPERILLLLELLDNPDEIRKQLFKEYPNYKWNIESGNGGKELLQFRKRYPNETVQTLETLIESNSSNQRKPVRQPNNRSRNIGNSTQ